MKTLKVNDKVKTALYLAACPIVCQAKGEDYDYYAAYHHRWTVSEVHPDYYLLKDSRGDTAKSDLFGNLLDEWIGHRIYKIK